MRPLRGGLAPQYAVLAEDLASHGYVVVGADIPHTAQVVVYGDGSFAYRTEAGAPPEFAPGITSPFAPGLPNDLFLPVLDVLVNDGSFLLDRRRRNWIRMMRDLLVRSISMPSAHSDIPWEGRPPFSCVHQKDVARRGSTSTAILWDLS
jgi:hypothetical protein